MDCVFEAQNEFRRRAELLRDILVSDLACLVTEYAVTEYQLFEESLHRRYHVKAEDARRGEYPTLTSTQHPLCKRYTDYLQQQCFSSKYSKPEQLRHALVTVRSSVRCNRSPCYYGVDHICNCGRPLLDADIRNGLVIPYF
jgi:hypothetical protein